MPLSFLYEGEVYRVSADGLFHWKDYSSRTEEEIKAIIVEKRSKNKLKNVFCFFGHSEINTNNGFEIKITYKRVPVIAYGDESEIFRVKVGQKIENIHASLLYDDCSENEKKLRQIETMNQDLKDLIAKRNILESELKPFKL